MHAVVASAVLVYPGFVHPCPRTQHGSGAGSLHRCPPHITQLCFQLGLLWRGKKQAVLGAFACSLLPQSRGSTLQSSRGKVEMGCPKWGYLVGLRGSCSPPRDKQTPYIPLHAQPLAGRSDLNYSSVSQLSVPTFSSSYCPHPWNATHMAKGAATQASRS